MLTERGADMNILSQLVTILNGDPAAVSAIRELRTQAEAHGVTDDARADAETAVLLACVYRNPKAWETYCDFVYAQTEDSPCTATH